MKSPRSSESTEQDAHCAEGKEEHFKEQQAVAVLGRQHSVAQALLPPKQPCVQPKLHLSIYHPITCKKGPSQGFVSNVDISFWIVLSAVNIAHMVHRCSQVMMQAGACSGSEQAGAGVHQIEGQR